MPKVSEVLKFKDGGPSVEEARKAMFAAGENPKGESQAGAPPVVVAPPAVVPPVAAEVLEPEFEEEIPAVPPAAVPVPATVVPTPVTVTPPKVERIETAQFVGEIKQEGGKWVAEIRYKTGAGTERFIENSRNELMLALLAGKGHATLRVNKAVRREKLGWSELDHQYPLPENTTVEKFEKLPDEQQDAMIWTIASQQIILFHDKHPEFYKTPDNAKAVNDFLVEHKLPITLRNLEYAFEDLTESDLLDKRPEVAPAREIPTPSLAPEPAPARTDSAPTPATPAPAPAAAPAAAAPAVVVRKRGTTGLQPGQSSSPTEPGSQEDGGNSREPSEAELRKLPLSELKRIADKDRRTRAGTQR